MSYANIMEYPCNIIVQTECGNERIDLDEGGRCCCRDILLEIKKQNDELKVYLSARTTKVKRIYFEWDYEMADEFKILGDAWERAYGDLEWRGIVPERLLPWYVIVYDVAGRKTHGYGVETGANAMCFWKIDGHRIMLCMDVRNGSMGVDLRGRCLHAATIVSRKGRDGRLLLKP